MSAAVAGRRAVLEALRAGRKAEKLYHLDRGHGAPFREILAVATAKKIPVEAVNRDRLDALCGHDRHQGVVLVAAAVATPGFGELVSGLGALGHPPLVVVLDELKDPQNVGAIVRTAEAAGADAVVTTYHRSAGEGPGLERASAGAVAHLPPVSVVNLREALERLKAAGIWVVGADMDATVDHTRADFSRPVALVLGEEGKGLRELTRKTCDELVRIPMRGKVASLNVSATAAILLFEAVRQRSERSR